MDAAVLVAKPRSSEPARHSSGVRFLCALHVRGPTCELLAEAVRRGKRRPPWGFAALNSGNTQRGYRLLFLFGFFAVVFLPALFPSLFPALAAGLRFADRFSGAFFEAFLAGLPKMASQLSR